MAGKMISLALDPKEAAEEAAPASPAPAADSDLPLYPYGTRLSLDTETLEALGIKEMPKVGSVFPLSGTVEVVGTSVNERQGGVKYSCLDLQITEMAKLGGGKPLADKMYGGATEEAE